MSPVFKSPLRIPYILRNFDVSLECPLNLKIASLNVDRKDKRNIFIFSDRLYVCGQFVHLCDYYKLCDNEYLIVLDVSH